MSWFWAILAGVAMVTILGYVFREPVLNMMSGWFDAVVKSHRKMPH